MFALSIAGCSSSGSKELSIDDPEQAYRIAKEKYDDHDYLAAIDDFSFIKIQFPGFTESDKVQFYLADSYYYRGEYILASYEFDNLIKKYQSKLVAEAKYKLGLCYYQLSPKYSLDQEYTNYAVEELQLFVEQYPDDINVPDAKAKLQELKNKLAYKEYHTGELYMKNSDYHSASLYFNYVYENYIDSDWAGPAMLGHAEALINLYKYKEADKILERFYKTFPKSDQKHRADELRSKTHLN
jgi:outer membrane protein assembly factor BamD